MLPFHVNHVYFDTNILQRHIDSSQPKVNLGSTLIKEITFHLKVNTLPQW
jgi:hypothetical protein